jgi:parallel beta-helix repeat protein
MAIAGMLILSSACSGNSSSNGAGTQATTPASSVSVSLSGAPADILVGTTLPIAAQVQGSSDTAVTWTVDDVPGGNSDVGTITGNGNTVTYVAPTAEGSHVVAAISVLDPTKVARGHVGIHQSIISSLAISPSTFSLNGGTQKQFAVTVTGTGTYDASVTWSAQLGTITSTGIYTAPSTAGNDVVTATSIQDTTKTTTAAVTVAVPSSTSSISSVALNPATLSLNVQAQNQFTATVTGTGNYNSAVTWSATLGTITSAGLYTAPSAGGTDVVTAKSVQDTTKTATASITVASASVPAGTSVKTYGAKGDGVTDDTAAIQACINAVAGKGGTVVVPDGTYMINGNYSGSFGLRLGSNMTFAMTSGAVLKVITNGVDNYSILTAGTVSNVTITGGTLTGDRLTHTGSSGQDGHGLVIGNASNITVTGLKATQCWGDGIYITNSSSNITVTNSICDHNYRMGMSATAVNGLNVSYSTFSNTGQDGPLLPGGGSGFDLEPNAGETVTNVNFSHNSVTGNAQYGIGTGGRYTSGAVTNYVTIASNTVTGNGSDGIYCNDGTTLSTVTSNTVTGNSGHGIELGEISPSNTVTGNTASNNSGYGIYATQCTGSTITGNTGSGNKGGGFYHDSCSGTYSPNSL